MIKLSNISIVVQGAVSSITPKVLENLRKIFLGAEIILSSWEGSDVNELLYDKVILSKDPGGTVGDKVSGVLNNVNRQITSTKAGIDAATRQYILKTRTDIIFNNNGFLEYFGKYDNKDSGVLKNRILICNYFTRNPRVMRLCFHPSDWIVFGNSDDIKRYYSNVSLQSSEEAEWFNHHSKSCDFFTNFIPRYTAEQHIFLGFIKSIDKDFEFECCYDSSKELISKTEKAFAKYFVVLDYGKELNIKFSKYNPNQYYEKYTLISHRKWKGLYHHYSLNKSSFYWNAYIFISAAYNVVGNIRKLLVNFLDFLGIKEITKSLLRKIKFGGSR